MTGLLNIHKPAGLTSRKVVDAVVKVAGTSRVGHAGTLDPLATGVLVVCIGSGTRLITHVQDARKEYRAEFLLGRRSDTDDVNGQVSDVAVTSIPSQADVEALLPRFLGRILQVPPAYSAVHVEGQRAHARARRGEQLDLAAREVDVFRVQLTGYSYPRLELDIECGSGTYVRSIGRDLGDLLGCGAVMSRLVRTRIGPFRLEDAVNLEELTKQSIAQHLLPLLTAVAHLPRLTCSEDELLAIANGRPVPRKDHASPPVDLVALTSPSDELVALARYSPEKEAWLPQQVFPTARVSSPGGATCNSQERKPLEN